MNLLHESKAIPLECGYVITASKKFNSTLEQLSSSLEMIGFMKRY
jgi:type III restriction enzyme